MKTALNAWTVERSTGFEEMFAQVAAAGFSGIELNVDLAGAHAITMDTTAQDYAAIRALSRRYNLPVVSISTSMWKTLMGTPEQWEDARKLLRKQLEAAAELDAGGILVVPGGMSDQLTLDGARKNCIAFLQSMKDEIEECGIFVGVENVWNGFFLSPYDMKSFIDEIGSEKIGAYLDLGNMLAFSVPEYWVEVLGNRIGRVHVKDFLRNDDRINRGGMWMDVTHGSANWQVIISELKKTGFDGYLTGEVSKQDEAMSYPEYYQKIAKEIASVIIE